MKGLILIGKSMLKAIVKNHVRCCRKRGFCPCREYAAKCLLKRFRRIRLCYYKVYIILNDI